MMRSLIRSLVRPITAVHNTGVEAAPVVPPSSNHILLGNGTDFLLLGNGTDKLLKAS